MLNRFTKLPPMLAERSAPTCCISRPMVENDLRLLLIDLGIDVAKLEHVCLHRLEEDSPGQLENAFLAGSGGDYETDRKIITARERFGHDREHLDSGNGPKFLLDDRQVRFRWRLACAPRF